MPGKSAKLPVWLLSIVLIAAACDGGGASPSASVSGSPAASEPAAGGSLVVVNPGGSYARGIYAAYLQPFENETGIQIEQVEGGDDPLAQIEAQVGTGNVLWDLVSCRLTDTLQNPDIWEPVDRSIVQSTDDLFYEHEVGELYVVNEISAFPILAYSTEAFPTAPTSWADFFDTEGFPGPRGVPAIGLSSAWFMPAVALLADGVTPEELFPLDLDRAYARLDELKPNVRVFWTGFTQSQDILRSGEVVMTPSLDGRALQLVANGDPVGVMWNQGFRNTGPWCIPKGAPNKENAFRFLEYILANPQQQAIFTSLTFYGPPTHAGVDAAEALGPYDFSTLHHDELIPDTPQRYEFIQENSDELLNRYNAWIEG